MPILTKEEITYFKENKQEITFELLQALRNLGNEGKQLALNILDLPKDNDQYYLDAFGNRVSQNGNRNLKKPFTKLNLSPIHIEEIDRCMNDIFYFMDNYVKIKTKQGVNFPELRTYQKDFISSILPDENEDNIGLMGRQCCSNGTTIKIINKTEEKVQTFEDLFNDCRNEAKTEIL
jgi:hypothetical protein